VGDGAGGLRYNIGVRVPFLVVGLATGLRLAWVLLVPTRPVGDFAMYVESAAHLVEHGALDPEFVYMPGYVLLLALVQAAGGGLLAAKLVGVALGSVAAGALYGIARALWGGRAALAAGLLYAVWPAGIAICAVTGTDLPAGALIAIAGWCLVRWGPDRPGLAAVLFGLVMGAAAWIRAVAVPLAALGAFYFRARGASWRAVAHRTAISCLVAAAVLAPWALRNRLRYGETFFTDSHGGLTALVGANPNSEGRYSRSLNRMFEEATGYRVLGEPHRPADRAAYSLALQLTRFDPVYAIGLVVAKAERLLASERPLLYWPLYRAGVLRDPQGHWFAERRRPLEAVVDAFWAFLVATAVFGLALAAVRGNLAALTFVPLQLALIAIYALFFAEVRYQIPIAMLLFPAAGAGVVALGEIIARRERQTGNEKPQTGNGKSGRGIAGGWAARGFRDRGVIFSGACVVALFAGWSVLLEAGARLRERHRWAVHVCRVAGQARLCQWRRAAPPAGDPGIRGVWDGVGLSLSAAAAAETAIPLPRGRYRVRAALDLAPADRPAAGGTATLTATGTAPFTAALSAIDERSRAGRTLEAGLEVAHAGGPLLLRLAVAPEASSTGAARLWLGDLRVDALAPGEER
jgi:4-amino-4-deoxy-L-arabinose transferase-like glycosyltransferase